MTKNMTKRTQRHAKQSRAERAKKYLDVKACGTRYACSCRHWYRLVDSGRAPQPTRFGRLVRWSIATLEAWETDGCRPVNRRAGR
jgi:predicted DNA-binding transcriptional regulator AlpA